MAGTDFSSLPQKLLQLNLGVKPNHLLSCLEMGTTSLNISVVDKRMLKQSEAASYSGLPLKHFKASCPVRPVELMLGALLWDRKDIDLWIDGVKSGEVNETRDDILGRL